MDKRKKWTDYEMGILHKYYPLEKAKGVFCRIDKSKTIKQILDKAARLGIKYKPKTILPNGKRTHIHNRLRTLQRHGVTPTQYAKMYAKQNGKCGICERMVFEVDPRNNTTRQFAIDHNHITGKIRGLLCTSCNTRLHIIENKEFRLKAEQYLKATDK